MGLFRSKTETYVETALTADIERGLVARYLARILERGDIPLRGLHTVLRWLNSARAGSNLGLDRRALAHRLQLLCGRHHLRRVRSRLFRQSRNSHRRPPRRSRSDIFFQMEEVPAQGLGFANLTPGDFAQARRQADMLGIAEDACRVVALLAEISRMKPGASLARSASPAREAEPP